jgi:hypothetical protein
MRNRRQAMPLSLHEVAPGAVAYFDHEVLLADPRIDRNDDSLNRPGPFVCVQVVGKESVWSAVTSEWRAERLLIEQEWRQGGSQRWVDQNQYLVDGLSTYLGPTDAFLRAAVRRIALAPHTRPQVLEQGIVAILAEIDKQGGPLLAGGS